MFRKLLLLVLSVTLVAPAKISLPPYLKKCSLSDPKFNQCFIDHANMAIPTLVKGDKKYHMPNLDPFKIDKISMDSANSNLHLDLTNVELYGLNKTAIVTADTDVINRNYTITFLVPNVEITADYEMKGSIMVLSLEGKGTCAFTFKNINCVYNIGFEQYTKDDVTYSRRTTSTIDYELDHATIHFDNLFNGNKQLGDEMNAVLNDNWKEISGEFKPAVSNTILQVVDSLFDEFLAVVPADELYDP